MKQNSRLTNHEDKKTGYVDWYSAFDGTQKKKKQLSSSVNQESFPIPPPIEDKESLIDKMIGQIHNLKDYLNIKFSTSSQEELTGAVNDALVHIAKETIAAADADGVRTEMEERQIEAAVASVVVQGAILEAGLEQSDANNPILELDQGGAQSDLTAAIAALHSENAVLPTGEGVAELAVQAIERGKKWNLIKTGPQLGSNEGGWYENPAGERFYVKFYDNPNQARAEFVANAIYQKLGIKSANSEIIELDGREAVASWAVLGVKAASVADQAASADVRGGFVADAFLANWDVVGLEYDNIVQNQDGFYRIDNGGSLIFRAQNGKKSYSPNSIPELKTMLSPEYPAGRVFAGMTEVEIGKQARELLEKLTAEDIKTIVDQSGLQDEDRDQILAGLLGRREFLVRTYGENQPQAEAYRRRPRLSEAIKTIDRQELESAGEMVIRARTEVICDRNHIEGQRIDVIDKSDLGVTELRFKLTDPMLPFKKLAKYNKTADGEVKFVTASGLISQRGSIVYEAVDSNNCHEVCDALVFEKAGVKMFLAYPAFRSGGRWLTTPDYKGDNLVQTAIGLVKIETPIDMPSEEVERIVGELLENDLGVPDALSEVSELAEKEYKIARYKWQYLINEELTSEQSQQAESLVQAEVFPGYTTFIDRGKHEEYLKKYGEDIRAFHMLFTTNEQSIYRVLTQGFMSTTERYMRGAIIKGLSSAADIDIGGADSVFTRIGNLRDRSRVYGDIVVFKPELFDRTDWYCYNEDLCGSTRSRTFAQRLSPDQMFEAVSDPEIYTQTNEQMFRTGIGVNFIESVQISEPRTREHLIKNLLAMGLSEVDGRPIEEVIVLRQNSSQIDEIDDVLTQARLESKMKMQAIINGTKSYRTIYEIFECADSGGDFNTNVKAMIGATIAAGQKAKLANDMASFLKDIFKVDELKALTDFANDPSLSPDDKDYYSYLQNVLGIDYNALYQESIEELDSLDDWEW